MRYAQAGLMIFGALLWIGIILAFFNGLIDREHSQAVVYGTVIGWNILLFVATVLVIVDAVVKIRGRRTDQLSGGVMLVKLAAIPFFIINFIVLALVSIGTVVFVGTGIIVAAVTTPMTYVAMLSTSVYGWAALIAQFRDRRIAGGRLAFYVVMLFVFVFDIVAGILIYGQARRSRVLAPTAGLASAPAHESIAATHIAPPH
ncbi:hypothetical protein GCM10027515_30130 [Schumannella luteola]|uniref:Glucan phosphoethanolaminetransferase (Alkaline phosphatase superfamily) n=1 Tax=Schumannella luteola TaxID=472059 RepID=A0A852Y8B4_9MICO|nr:hypothetical protein [Schumannella luteola]NYG99186.1 glucan phosphoethanolaminetransferase (alkaline phosphatase superfamily) [Schumannella luteola]TPW90540.1 hypothetical protein FJ656_36945 [Schumannella luteola]